MKPYSLLIVEEDLVNNLQGLVIQREQVTLEPYKTDRINLIGRAARGGAVVRWHISA